MKCKLFVLLCLCLGLTLSACGKKGSPDPQDQKNLFAWKSAEARFANDDCLSISAAVSGASRNVDSILLELEVLEALEDESLLELVGVPNSCEGCPFTPRESHELEPSATLSEDGTAHYAFTYCPRMKATAYRWRLVARNVFLSFPYVLTPVGTVRR